MNYVKNIPTIFGSFLTAQKRRNQFTLRITNKLRKLDLFFFLFWVGSLSTCQTVSQISNFDTSKVLFSSADFRHEGIIVDKCSTNIKL